MNATMIRRVNNLGAWVLLRRCGEARYNTSNWSGVLFKHKGTMYVAGRSEYPSIMCFSESHIPSSGSVLGSPKFRTISCKLKIIGKIAGRFLVKALIHSCLMGFERHRDKA